MPQLHRHWRTLGQNLGLGLLCALFIIAPNLKGSLILEDPFHEGEFFATTVSYLAIPALPFQALSIHGAVDVMPALLARLGWGDSHYFLPTVALYAALNILAAALLLLIADALSRQRPFHRFLWFALALAAPFFVGYRDVLLLAALYVFLLIQGRPWRLPIATTLRLALGALIAFGMFWSFDRGIACVVALGPPLLVLACKRRLELCVALGFVLTVAVLGLFFSLGAYLDNVRVLLTTSGQWSYGWRLDALMLSLFAAAISLTSIALALRSAWHERGSLERLAQHCTLILLALITLKIGLNRADVEHVYSALWAPLCLLLSLPRKDLAIGRGVILLPLLIGVAATLSFIYHSPGFFLITCLMAYAVTPHHDSRDLRLSHLTLMALISLSAAALLYSTGKHVREDQYQWLTHLAAPPDNTSAVTPGVRWAAARLQEQQVDCVFDLSNNGVINGLLNRPSCSRFTYPVYATAAYEPELIDAVSAAAPAVIVYASTFPSYRIDGRDMRERFPQLDSFLLARYPNEICDLGYCVRYRE